ncbi:MAG: T9SS type A sorting domain-containing protein, partial [Bacteroidales bacterium]|nr:T9SS type A sorting domain-containing protein [Bacteroidales bacterium]
VTLHLTLHVGIGDHSANNITLYPNPTRGTVQIRNSGSNILSVTVFDASGRMLNTVNVNDHTATIDLSGYAVGTYFLRIMTENGVVTKRVVKSE